MTRLSPSLRKPPGHADDWLMTYADTITLLLCFFVVLVVVSATHKALPVKVEAPPEVTAQAAPPPAPAPLPRLTIVWAQEPPPPETKSRSAAAGNAEAKSIAVVATATARPDAPPPPAPPASLRTAEAEASPPPAVIPPPALADTPKPAAAPADAPPGDRITTLDIGSAAFFDSGSAALLLPGKAILRDMLPRLQAAVAEGYRIKVEGHTDDTPIDTSAYPSNWELSSARAAAVVHYLIEEGIAPERLRAVGYADTEPKAPDRDAAGHPIPQNQALNRRVVIQLEKIAPATP